MSIYTLSPQVERAFEDTLRVGKALLKTISPNDVGLTGSHQAGYYLPGSAWSIFTPFAPTKGVNNNHEVTVVWPDGIETQSVVKWYGRATRSEYRLTRFNRIRNFPYLTEDCVGSLLVLIPERIDLFLAYVFDFDDDIDDIVALLGVDLISGWAVYPPTETLLPESESACIDRRFREIALHLDDFPATDVMADSAYEALRSCVKSFERKPVDDQLVRMVAAEYELFQMIERKIYQPEIRKLFQSISDFLSVASSIMNRRKNRAGKSLELHVRRVLTTSGIPYEANPLAGGTIPDILIPGLNAYADQSYPRDRLFMLGIKTTCKDRWRQVLSEAPGLDRRYLLTMQKGISTRQLREMRISNLSLIVPRSLHDSYPTDGRSDLYSVDEFLNHVKHQLAQNQTSA